MKIVIAPDSYKECLSAPEVASIVAEELRRCRPDVETVECPLSDGGEGFLEVVTAALGGCLVRAAVTGPMGERVEACFGRAGETGIIDAASASGLMRVPPERRNPLLATSLGTGELMVAAFRSGCRRLLIGLGGTATCDGGEGMMRAEGIDALRGRVEIEALCDVDNPFVGPRGAARVFAPQKGAGPEMVEMLEEERAGMRAELAGAGHATAAVRALSYFSATAAIMDQVSGIEEYRTVDRVCTDLMQEGEAGEKAAADLSRVLAEMAACIFCRDNLIIDDTAGREDLAEIRPDLEQFVSALPAAGERMEKIYKIEPVRKNEGFRASGGARARGVHRGGEVGGALAGGMGVRRRGDRGGGEGPGAREAFAWRGRYGSCRRRKKRRRRSLI